MRAVGETLKDFFALRAFVAAGQKSEAQPGGFAEFGERLMMLAGENFGRRHQRRLPPGLDHRRHGKSATIVLPDPTSPCKSRSIRVGAARSASISAIAVRLGAR